MKSTFYSEYLLLHNRPVAVATIRKSPNVIDVENETISVKYDIACNETNIDHKLDNSILCSCHFVSIYMQLAVKEALECVDN
jgi:hypothetical protein